MSKILYTSDSLAQYARLSFLVSVPIPFFLQDKSGVGTADKRPFTA